MIINDSKISPSKMLSVSRSTYDNTSILSKETLNTRMKKRKIIILGKMGVGKSSIIKRFVDNTATEKTKATMEETFNKNYFYKNEELRLIILDTAGQSEYTPALPNRYCIGVHGYILAFSIDDNHSFEVIQHVNRVLLESIGTKYIPRILVGNKKDLESSREVSLDRIKKLAKALKCPYIECSATEGGAEIEKIFYKLLKEVDKESNDEYPYDIKNSTMKMNFIRKHHKNFNLVLLVLLATIFVSIHI
jgi:small GTP-binding protein